MHAFEAVIVPLQIRGHDSEIRSASSCNQYGNKYFDRLHIRHPWPTVNQLESGYFGHRPSGNYAAAIAARGSPLDNCFGFVDGTVRPTARPGENQRILYNGHKRVHAIKFQSVVLPNGLIGNMYGPVGEAYSHVAVVLLYKCDTDAFSVDITNITQLSYCFIPSLCFRGQKA